jgi:uncharacterized membrane protein YgaE (UPF0421/DUF939 family)
MKQFIEKLKGTAPSVDMHYRIGMRVLKTVTAVSLCLLIAWRMGSTDSLPIAAISALVTLQATQGETLRIGAFRVLGTVIGGVFGILTVLIGLFLPYYSEGLFIVVIPLMLMLNLYLCNILNMQDSCTISCVVTLIVAAHIITDVVFDEALVFTFVRLRDTLIGVFVATAVNLIPYKPSKG